VGNVSNAVFYRSIWLCGRPGALDPLTLKILWNLTADKGAVARLLNLDLCSSDRGLGIEESNPLLVLRPPCPPFDACCHHSFAIRIQIRQGFQGGYRLWGENVRVKTFEIA